MGLRLEVLKWEDQSGGRQIVARMPESGMADIKLGARAIVQESQAAVVLPGVFEFLPHLRSPEHELRERKCRGDFVAAGEGPA